MNKYRIAALLVALSLSTAACKPSNTELEQGSETSTQLTDNQVTTVVIEGANPIGDDVYETGKETVDAQDITVEIIPSDIDDPDFDEKMETFLDPIYYNIFFGQGNYIEGIDEGAMVKFAISYIYQHEYNELKFDTTSFVLYVPGKRVEEIVEKYFDYHITGHHSFIEANVMYEDDFYLMPAVDTGWSETLSVDAAKATGDFSYDVTLKLSYESDEAPFYKQAHVEVRDGRYVLVGYVDYDPDNPNQEGVTGTTAVPQTTTSSD